MADKFQTVVRAIIIFLAFIQLAHAAEPADLYAVVEIGSKGVKSHVFDLDKSEKNEACQTEAEQYLACVAPRTVDTADVTAIEKDKADTVVKVVLAQVNKLRQVYGIRNERLFLVASSGVGSQEHFVDLKAKIESAQEPRLSVDDVTADQEARFAFEGVLAMLPAKYRKTRADQALLIDIGGGNIKFSYKSRATGDLEGFGLEWGVKPVTNTVMQRMKEQGEQSTFSAVADEWTSTELKSALRSTLDKNQETLNRSRIYVIGGTAWAISNFTQPDNIQKFPKISTYDISRYIDQVTNWPNPVCDSHPARNSNKDILKVCNVFSKDNLISGAYILRELAVVLALREKDSEQKGRTMFFFRESMFAWPLGFLKSKLNPTDEDTVP